ncbi:hypothetical protein Dthio_PD1525 [Desulfonatronospira thiodismutans ASO3-1]|uniref:Uncharacterized protein n=1 Tax=Desulfonatronospira thiodismutans ASO3-1 TaxID=555779 RepID=D6SN51_9BACT|nr:hypothetical protein [Desulfonatronospira thiodismutans]EFI34177.1 hypothetical protein Dthio_PD1525 [Desulfonatronospira thiodismutans ASO3-1]
MSFEFHTHLDISVDTRYNELFTDTEELYTHYEVWTGHIQEDGEVVDGNFLGRLSIEDLADVRVGYDQINHNAMYVRGWEDETGTGDWHHNDWKDGDYFDFPGPPEIEFHTDVDISLETSFADLFTDEDDTSTWYQIWTGEMDEEGVVQGSLVDTEEGGGWVRAEDLNNLLFTADQDGHNTVYVQSYSPEQGKGDWQHNDWQESRYFDSPEFPEAVLHSFPSQVMQANPDIEFNTDLNVTAGVTTFDELFTDPDESVVWYQLWTGKIDAEGEFIKGSFVDTPAGRGWIEASDLETLKVTAAHVDHNSLGVKAWSEEHGIRDMQFNDPDKPFTIDLLNAELELQGLRWKCQGIDFCTVPVEVAAGEKLNVTGTLAALNDGLADAEDVDFSLVILDADGEVEHEFTISEDDDFIPAGRSVDFNYAWYIEEPGDYTAEVTSSADNARSVQISEHFTVEHQEPGLRFQELEWTSNGKKFNTNHGLEVGEELTVSGKLAALEGYRENAEDVELNLVITGGARSDVSVEGYTVGDMKPGDSHEFELSWTSEYDYDPGQHPYYTLKIVADADNVDTVDNFRTFDVKAPEAASDDHIHTLGVSDDNARNEMEMS